MDKKRIALWVVIGILAVLVVYVTFFKGSASSADVGAQAIKSTAQASRYSGMVGGC